MTCRVEIQNGTGRIQQSPLLKLAKTTRNLCCSNQLGFNESELSEKVTHLPGAWLKKKLIGIHLLVSKNWGVIYRVKKFVFHHHTNPPKT